MDAATMENEATPTRTTEAAPAQPPSLGEIARFAAPLVLGLITAALHSVVDTLYVGRLGTAEVAAVGIAATLYFVGVMLFIGLTRNSIAFVGRAYGEGRPEQIGAYVAQYQWIAIAALPILWAGAAVYPWVAGLSRMTPQVEALGWHYLIVRLWGVPLFLTVVLYSAVHQAVGNSVLPMAISWFELTVKSALNYVFIFGMWGVPALGLPGAAWATIVAELMSAGVMLAIVYSGPLRQPFRLRVLAWPQWRLMRRVLAVGVPQ